MMLDEIGKRGITPGAPLWSAEVISLWLELAMRTAVRPLGRHRRGGRLPIRLALARVPTNSYNLVTRRTACPVINAGGEYV